ncbi:hypothetical protein [Burkholderia singularis]|uniref:hypothetical protein n=1 Tax=Burkholderia singularis TaxID=1503053 RepID=UPI000F796B2F|nr:hypothetical protein [Burkholderia singularis]
MRLIRLGNRMRKCAASADAAQFSAAKRDERPFAARHGRKPGHAHGTADVCHDRSGSRMDLHEASRPNAGGADNGHRFPIPGWRLIGGVIEGCVLAEKPTLRESIEAAGIASWPISDMSVGSKISARS